MSVAEPIKAIDAYRRPGKPAYWDENLTERVGRMQMDNDGNLAIKRGDRWVEVGSQHIFYTAGQVLPRRRLTKPL